MAQPDDLVPGLIETVPAAIHRMIRERAADTAVTTSNGDITYTQLHDLAGRMAQALDDAGVGPGDTVAVCLPRSIEQIAALYAAWQVGAAYLPLDPAWPEARQQELIARAGARALIATAEHGQRVAGNAALVDPARLGATLFAAPCDPMADDLAYVIFTSGSTGEPKGVEITHGNLAALVAWHCGAFKVGADTRTSHLAGLGFDAAAWEVWPTLAAGGTLALVDDATRVDAPKLRDWLIANHVEVAFAPTALAEPLVAMGWPADTRLRVLLTGADKLTRRPNAGLPFVFVNNYGPTESTVVATSGVVVPEGEGLPSIGKAIAGTEIHLLDPSAEPVTEGAAGEICIGGAQVGRGYRGNPDETAQRFIDHPCFGRLYRTGDLAMRGADGDYLFLGRVDGQVKVRGHRVEPAEVAAALHRVAGVQQAIVVAHDGALVGYVVADQDLTASSLRAALSESLPDYMVPARFARLEALPLTANGKVDIRSLPTPESCAMAEGATGGAPRTPTEERLFAIIAEVIGRDDFGVDDDFFLLGGHSLLGTQVIVRARDAFGVELNLFHLFEGRTVAALAAKVEELIIEMLDGMSDEDIQRMSAA